MHAGVDTVGRDELSSVPAYDNDGDNTMERRKFVIGLGSAAAGASALVGSGAFNIVRAERDITVNVADDPFAYLGLDPESEYAETDSGQLAITFEDNSQGNGINDNAKSVFYNVFRITNQGTKDVQVTVGTGDNTAYDVNNPIMWWTHSELSGSGVIVGDGRWDEDNTAFLEPGDSIFVHFTFDLLGELVDDPDDPEDLEKITIYAEQTTSDDEPVS